MKGYPYHYLDNSATTNVCREAAEKAAVMMTDCFGNPSSLHSLGFNAEQELAGARRAAAALLGAAPENITFTSGGTEANNLALFGCAEALSRRGKHIITTAVEHSSVTEPLAVLEKQGFAVTRLLPGRDGMIRAEQVAEACRPDTVLVSIMLVNNETGARFPLEDIVPAVRKLSPLAKIHCDAVQAAGKIPLRVDKLGVDLLSMSGHKLHAPKGSGALYHRAGCRLIPRVYGGGQECGLRPGTEAVPAWAAMGAAIRALPDPAEFEKAVAALSDRLTEGLTRIPGVVLHRPACAVPYIVNFSVPGLRSETLLHFLAEREVYVSSGSACAKGRKSPVLTAMGLSEQEIDSALRISLSRFNDSSDIDALLEGISEAAAVLSRRK